MRKIRRMLIVLIGIFSLTISCSQSNKEGKNNELANNTIEKKYTGYVPDELTAKKIAEAIWLPIYSSSVLDEKPYKARIIGDSVWIVEGTLERGKSGGTAYIEIRMNDCKILNVTHGK